MIGPSMRDAAIGIVPWIALAGLFTGLSDYFSDAFMLARKAKERMIIMLVPTILNIVLNIILLPKLGINGAVIATVISFALGLLLLAIIGRRHIIMPIPWLQTAKIAVACLAMAITVSFLPDFGGFVELLAKSTIGALTYGAALVALDFNGARNKIAAYIRK
jgi:O-antigen/teichoic acid export membrane protein